MLCINLKKNQKTNIVDNNKHIFQTNKLIFSNLKYIPGIVNSKLTNKILAGFNFFNIRGKF